MAPRRAALSPIKQLLQDEVKKHALVGHLPREVAVMYREALAEIQRLDEWERMFAAWCLRAMPQAEGEPLWPNPNWSQDVAMVAHALSERGG